MKKHYLHVPLPLYHISTGIYPFSQAANSFQHVFVDVFSLLPFRLSLNVCVSVT